MGILNFADLAQYAPYEGSGDADLFSHDGIFAGIVSKVTDKKSNTGKEYLSVVFTVSDEDNKGKQTYANVQYQGVDKNGKSMARQLGDLLYSIGMSAEQIRSLAGNGKTEVSALIPQLLNKVAYAECEAESYEGKTTSRVQNFVGATRYAAAKASGAWRKPISMPQSAVQPLGTVQSAQAQFGIGGPVSNGAAMGNLLGTPMAQPANDPLKAAALFSLPQI